MEFPITNGKCMNTVIQQDHLAVRRMSLSLRVGCWLAGVLLVPLWGGCARLHPMSDSGSDVQVAADSLKTAVREAQRSAAELRGELEEQRKELADAQLARAQLQGMLRETERRLDEARQIIELQREELTSARVERERMAQTIRPSHERFRHPASTMPNSGKMHAPDAAPAMPTSTGQREKVVPLAFSKEEVMPETSPFMAEAGPVSEESRPALGAIPEVVPVAPIRTVVVQNGDTLWRLSRRHKVSLHELRALNGVLDNLIVTGRTLRLPEPRIYQTESQASMGALVR